MELRQRGVDAVQPRGATVGQRLVVGLAAEHAEGVVLRIVGAGGHRRCEISKIS